jgi:hypothetical protein
VPDGDQFGLWLSLVERLVRDQEAVGSNPTSPITNFQRKLRERQTDAKAERQVIEQSIHHILQPRRVTRRGH